MVGVNSLHGLYVLLCVHTSLLKAASSLAPSTVATDLKNPWIGKDVGDTLDTQR